MKINEIQNFDIESLEGYLENASIGIHIVDKEGVIIWANAVELEMLGYEASEYIGHNITEFHESEDVIQDILCKLLSGESIKNYEASLSAKDGSTVNVLISSNTYQKDGEVVHSRCFTNNITVIKKDSEKIDDLQHKLEKSERKYKDLIDATETGYVILDLDFNVLDANQRYVDMFGFDKVEEVLGYSLRECLNGDNMDIFDESFNKVKNGEAVADIELELTNKKREYVAIRMHANLIENGKNKLFCLVRDISEKKKAEKEKAETRAIRKREIIADMQNFKQCLS
jgi:PAS domain S-box-containing protein